MSLSHSKLTAEEIYPLLLKLQFLTNTEHLYQADFLIHFSQGSDKNLRY